MGFRGLLMTVGMVLTVGSLWLGEWTAWIGITMFFFGLILYFIDKE